MSDILGGGVWKNVATVACGVVGLGSAVYYIGAATQCWNVIGWVCMTLNVADLACIGYGFSQIV